MDSQNKDIKSEPDTVDPINVGEPVPEKRPNLLVKQKTLQPSKTFVAEMKEEAAKQPVEKPKANPVNNQGNPEADVVSLIALATPATTVPKPSSIYPEATGGYGNAPYNALDSNSDKSKTDKENNSTKLIIVIVTIIGGLIAGGALYEIIAWSIIILGSKIGSNYGLFIIPDILYLVLGVGIVLRRELARIIYVFLAILGLIIGSIGIISFLSSINSQNSRNNALYTQAIVNTQNQITRSN